MISGHLRASGYRRGQFDAQSADVVRRVVPDQLGHRRRLEAARKQVVPRCRVATPVRCQPTVNVIMFYATVGAVTQFNITSVFSYKTLFSV